MIELLEGRLTPTTYTVNLTTDFQTLSGGVSTGANSGDLRYCVASVNADGSGSADTIQFDPTVFNGAQSAIVLGGAALEISRTTGSVTIDGLAGGAANVVIDANHSSGVFQVDSSVTATFNGLTIENGMATQGGGIMTAGTLLVSNSTIRGNTASGGTSQNGGGIMNSGILTVLNSTLSNNTAVGLGGGIYDSVFTYVYNSTIADNTAADGGGIYQINHYQSVDLTNCTVSGNSANFAGGIDITIDGDASNGAHLRNTLVAGNFITGSPQTASDIEGRMDLVWYNNLLGSDCSGIVANGYEGNIVLSPGQSAGLDPNGLASNGSTRPATIALLPGSPAIDAGSNALALDNQGNPLTTDERGTGFARIVNNTVDIGAYEYDSFRSDFVGPASQLPNPPWKPVLGGGFSINSSEQAVSSPLVNGLYKAETVENLSLTNASVSADVALNPTPANGISAVAVIARSQDANDVNNCYFAALTPAPGGLDQILIEKTVNGQISGIAAKALPAGTTSGNLTLEVYGNTLAAYLNGRLEVIGTDSTFTAAGGTGIGAQDAGATAANVLVSGLQSPPGAFTDNFTRPASDSLGNPWYVNSALPANNTTGPGGGFGISGSDQAITLTAGPNVATLFGVNHSNTTVSATVVNAGNGAGVVADWNNATQSGYELLLSNWTLQFYRVVNGTATMLGTAQPAWGMSGTVGMHVSGGTLMAYFDGSFVFSISDSSFTTGSAGMVANGAGATFSGFSLSGS